jgi:Flp pilus assembly protein TadD
VEDAGVKHLLLLVVLCLGGCVAPATQTVEQGLSVAELLSGGPIIGLEPLPELPDAALLEVSDGMRSFLDRFVDRRANAHLRLQQLVYAVVSDSIFGLEYTDATRTAAATFSARNGNCLSFTSMFVAMAREVGLRASYQQIDVPPDWEQRGDTFVLNRHINVLVEMGPGSQKAVDFNIDDFKTSYARHKVSDRRAEAHYHSNLGVERMQAGDLRLAFAHLRRGLEIDERFSPLWTNLGTLYLRASAPLHAEHSYLQALEHDRSDMVAMSNLARLYQGRGDVERATHYQRLVRIHRERNPYYRYQMARSAFFALDYPAVLRHLGYALRKKPEEDAFYFLRGLVHLQMGDGAKARSDMQKAESIAADSMLKRNYHSKMEMLLSEQRDKN